MEWPSPAADRYSQSHDDRRRTRGTRRERRLVLRALLNRRRTMNAKAAKAQRPLRSSGSDSASSASSALNVVLYQRIWFRRPRAVRCRTSPIIVTDHAASATYSITREMISRNGASIAFANRNVHTVYMPSGKTAPQYNG